MPAEETTALSITCDNPACPGNKLDPGDRTGWRFVRAEIYGLPMLPERVFCSADCLAGYSAAVAAGELDWAEPLPA